MRFVNDRAAILILLSVTGAPLPGSAEEMWSPWGESIEAPKLRASSERPAITRPLTIPKIQIQRTRSRAAARSGAQTPTTMAARRIRTLKAQQSVSKKVAHVPDLQRHARPVSSAARTSIRTRTVTNNEFSAKQLTLKQRQSKISFGQAATRANLQKPSSPATAGTQSDRHEVVGSALDSSTPPTAVKRDVHRIVVQVTQNDPTVMHTALNNAENIIAFFKGKGEKSEIEFVTFGPGLHMLRSDTSPVRARLSALAGNSTEITFSGCGNTLKDQAEQEGKDVTLISEARVVPAGVGRIVDLQEQGWTYVRP